MGTIVSTDGGDLDTKDIRASIRVWDVATGQRLQELRGHTKYIYSIAVSLMARVSLRWGR